MKVTSDHKVPYLRSLITIPELYLRCEFIFSTWSEISAKKEKNSSIIHVTQVHGSLVQVIIYYWKSYRGSQLTGSGQDGHSNGCGTSW